MSLTQIYQGESVGITLHSELPLDGWSVTVELFTLAADYRIVGACPDREGFLSIENEGQTLKMQIPPAECAKLSEGILSLHITLARDYAVKKGTIRLAEILSARTTATQRTSVEQQLVFMDNDIQLSLDMGPKVSDDGHSAYEIAVQNGYEGSEEEWLAMLPGADGHTPYVGPNGNWWIDGRDSGKPSRGPAPVKGIDYFTEEELAQVAAEAAALVPPVDVSGPIADHDASVAAHEDIREAIEGTAGRFGDYYDKTQTYTCSETDARLDTKVDAVAGKGLSTNDYTNEDRAAVATIPGKAESDKTYTTVVNTPEWSNQPAVEGALNPAFAAYPEDYYLVTLKDANGEALAADTFRLTAFVTAKSTADHTRAIDQTFTLAGLETGNSGVLKESMPVDFTAVGDGWRLRSGGVSAIKIDIDEQYRQGYDLNILTSAKFYKFGYAYYTPFEARYISDKYFAISGVGDGYMFGNQFLFPPSSWANVRKHSYSNEVFRLRILPTVVLVEYSRSMMGYDGTLNNRTAVVNGHADGARVNGIGFSLDEQNHPVSALRLSRQLDVHSVSPYLNGSSFRLTLKKRN